MTESDISFEFECPKCSSSRFATSKDGRHCNGHEDGRTCKFTWPASDDWRYAIRVTRERFESRDEYERGLG